MQGTSTSINLSLWALSVVNTLHNKLKNATQIKKIMGSLTYLFIKATQLYLNGHKEINKVWASLEQYNK